MCAPHLHMATKRAGTWCDSCRIPHSRGRGGRGFSSWWGQSPFLNAHSMTAKRPERKLVPFSTWRQMIMHAWHSGLPPSRSFCKGPVHKCTNKGSAKKCTHRRVARRAWHSCLHLSCSFCKGPVQKSTNKGSAKNCKYRCFVRRVWHSCLPLSHSSCKGPLRKSAKKGQQRRACTDASPGLHGTLIYAL